MPKMTTKERILATIRREPVDHVPLCVDAICHGRVICVTQRYPDDYRHAKYFMDMGLDTGILLDPPYLSMDDVEIRQWRQHVGGERYTILSKEYVTQKGSLRQVVRETDDYPDTIDLFSDHNVPPSRSKEYLINTEADLEKLECFFRVPTGSPRKAFIEEAAAARRFCDDNGLILSAYLWGVGDPIVWMSGVQGAILAAMDRPEFFSRYVEVVAGWQRDLVELAIDAGVDLIVRRGWYESTDFWSPSLYERYFLGPLSREVAMAHQAGVIVTYVMDSGAMPLLGFFEQAGIDIYSNIDPAAPHTDVVEIKRTIGGAVTLCGGINNYHVLEHGTTQQVVDAVDEAMASLAGDGGFILAPADGIMGPRPERSERNFHTMVDAWKKVTRQT